MHKVSHRISPFSGYLYIVLKLNFSSGSATAFFPGSCGLFQPLVFVRISERLLPTSPKFAYGVGALGYGLGLAASAWWDLPSGAAIACVLCLLANFGLVGKSSSLMRTKTSG